MAITSSHRSQANQELWLANLGWDEQIPAHIQKRWETFHQNLRFLENIKIPRWIQQYKDSRIEVHGFCDASEKAYGAAVYIKAFNGDHEVKISLLTSRSKVAPAKTKITLPRLELCAAILLAKLLHKVITTLEFQIQSKVFAWSDSMITLYWIKGEAPKWKTFIANRVSTINKLTHASCWHHVKSEDNPADAISRGMDPSKIESHSIWWHGPQWLGNYTYPINDQITDHTNEMKRQYQANLHIVNPTTNEISERFSSWFKMIRVMAYCNRFINRCRKQTTDSAHLTTAELKIARKQIIRIEQQLVFKHEISNLRKNKPVKTTARYPASIHFWIKKASYEWVEDYITHSYHIRKNIPSLSQVTHIYLD